MKLFPQQTIVTNSGLVYVDVAKEEVVIQFNGTLRVPLSWWRQHEREAALAVTVQALEPATRTQEKRHAKTEHK